MLSFISCTHVSHVLLYSYIYRSAKESPSRAVIQSVSHVQTCEQSRPINNLLDVPVDYIERNTLTIAAVDARSDSAALSVADAEDPIEDTVPFSLLHAHAHDEVALVSLCVFASLPELQCSMLMLNVRKGA